MRGGSGALWDRPFSRLGCLQPEKCRDSSGIRSPAARPRHPRVVSLTTVGTTPGFIVETATIEDGGIAAYRLRFTLQERTDRWLASSV